MNRWLSLSLLVCLAGLSACATPPASTPNGDDFSLAYRRSGGIAGFDDELTISAGGAAQVRRRDSASQITLVPEKLTELKRLVQQADFFNLKSDYPAAPGGADYFNYSITVRSGGREHTVRTQTTAVPPALEPLIRELDRLLAGG